MVASQKGLTQSWRAPLVWYKLTKVVQEGLIESYKAEKKGWHQFEDKGPRIELLRDIGIFCQVRAAQRDDEPTVPAAACVDADVPIQESTTVTCVWPSRQQRHPIPSWHHSAVDDLPMTIGQAAAIDVSGTSSSPSPVPLESIPSCSSSHPSRGQSSSDSDEYCETVS